MGTIIVLVALVRHVFRYPSGSPVTTGSSASREEQNTCRAETASSDNTNVVRGQQITCTYSDWFIWQHQRCERTADNVHIQRLVYLTTPAWNKYCVHTETGLSDSTSLEQILCTHRDWFIWQHQLGTNTVHIQRLVYLTAPAWNK